ncbi:MAG: hypothetical protein N5P05_001237 [Chroococcopsis gigantea SAG 12.99]|jgi:hypothetical protein|nr:hypothetical protein [Chlorogloea purpurea SAG 13.99]MDV2999631.1 hypothetical protein [Chroococcopsis gigantea SAG 12.99]
MQYKSINGRKINTVVPCLLGAIGGLFTVTDQVKANSLSVIKTVERGRNVVYVKNLTPGQTVEMLNSGGTRPAAILANSCGMIRLRPSQHDGSNVKVNGQNISISDPEALITAACNGTTAPGTSNVLKVGEDIYIKGLTPSVAATVMVPSTGSRSVRANGCGLARFAESESSPWSSSSQFSIAGSVYTFGQLSNQAHAPYCRNVGSSGSPSYVRYEPAI